ncbi:MAG: ABC transporter permease [Thermonemataceae bacterium]|nr:ABC transporter permease [Thermonemataceae bacterium]
MKYLFGVLNNWQRIALYYNVALEALNQRKLRSFLAGIGIMFGVASIMAMLALGQGLKQQILKQLTLIGSNTIIVSPKSHTDNQQTPHSLQFSDVEHLQDILPNLEIISPEIHLDVLSSYEQKWIETKLYGVNSDYFKLMKLECQKGAYFKQAQQTAAVCIIGKQLENKLFGGKSGLGKYIRCNNQWLEVVGVLENQPSIKSNLDNIGLHNTNLAIYAPIKSVFYRFDGAKKNNINTLSRLLIQVKNPRQLLKTAEFLAVSLKRLHYNKVDFEIIIPEKILEERLKMQKTLNYALAIVAFISLLTGGIGIMNVMLTAVLERLQEIGIRKALGAKSVDIHLQFLLESLIISFLGAFLGLIIGLGLIKSIAFLIEIELYLSWNFILICIGTGALIGIIFGWYPARKAAQYSPQELLKQT